LTTLPDPVPVQEGWIDAGIVIEMGLNAFPGHVTQDRAKLIKSAVHVDYVSRQ